MTEGGSGRPWLPQEQGTQRTCLHVGPPVAGVRSEPSYLMGSNLHSPGACDSQEAILRTGFLFWFISSQHTGAEQMDRKLPGLTRVHMQLPEF